MELKSPVGKTSQPQDDWLAKLKEDGWLVGVCRTLDEAIDLITAYAASTAV